MFKNLFIATVRSIRRNILYSFLNTAGLTIVFASVIILGMFIRYELSYDSHISDADSVYRVIVSWGGSRKMATSPAPLAQVIRDEIPGVIATTRLYRRHDFTFKIDKDTFKESGIYYADEDYFMVFKNILIVGDANTALRDPNSIVLSRSLARKYFPDLQIDDILNQEIVNGGRRTGRINLKVTGVFEDVPKNSHQKFNGLISSSSNQWMHTNQGWSWNSIYTYIHLDYGTSESDVETKLVNLVKLHVVPYLGYNLEDYETSGNTFEFLLQPLTSIHLHSSFLKEIKANGSIDQVQIFVVISILLILIGASNYVNLSTAQSLKRTKEFGLRRVLGSGRPMLIVQFMLESFLLSIFAVIISLGFVELFMTFFADRLGLEFTFEVVKDFDLSIIIIVSGIAIGLISGIFPAIIITGSLSIQPLSKITSKMKSGSFSNTLVVIQFFVSGGLIIATGVVSDQLNYMNNKQLGYQKEDVVIVLNDREISHRRGEFNDIVSSMPNVVSAGFSTGLPGLLDFKVRDISLEGTNFQDGMRWYQFDDSFPVSMGLKLKSGRWFDRDLTSDSLAVIINESAVDVLGLENPIDARLIINEGENDEQKVRIVGVVEDFHSESLHYGLKPIVVGYLHDFTFKDFIAIHVSNKSRGIQEIKDIWNRFNPDVPMNYYFLDDNIKAMSVKEYRLANVFMLFSIITVVVACLGLFGLASYTTTLRQKEIGIRKVLGSSVSQAIYLLSKKFTLLALLGYTLSIPVGYILMQNWLKGFVFRTDFSPYIILYTGLLLFTVSLIAVFSQALEAAYSNPVDMLKED